MLLPCRINNPPLPRNDCNLSGVKSSFCPRGLLFQSLDTDWYTRAVFLELLHGVSTYKSWRRLLTPLHVLTLFATSVAPQRALQKKATMI